MERNLKEEITVAETGFLFDHVTGLTYTVNETGRFMLQRMIEGLSAADIIKAVAERFDVSETVARKDLEDFYEQMRTLGIL
jgi:hypothetical protein